MSFRVAVDRLGLSTAQDALGLLRFSFGAPRAQNLLHCSPSADHTNLQTFDSWLKQALSHIINSDLVDLQWFMASLPIEHYWSQDGAICRTASHFIFCDEHIRYPGFLPCTIYPYIPARCCLHCFSGLLGVQVWQCLWQL